MSWIQCFVRKRFDKALDVQGGLWIICGGFPSHSMFVPLLCLSKGGSYLIWGGLFLVFPREKSPISCIGSSQTDVPSIKTSRRYIGSHINQSTRSSSEKSQSQTKVFFLQFQNSLSLKCGISCQNKRSIGFLISLINKGLSYHWSWARTRQFHGPLSEKLTIQCSVCHF